MTNNVRTAPDRSLVVLRHGELFLKGANRSQFEQLLQSNIKGALRDLGPVELERGQGRFYLHVEARRDATARTRLRHVFGLSSLSPAIEVTPDPQRLVADAVAIVGRLLGDRRPRSFKVAARRSDKRFPLTSPEVSRNVGGAIAEHLGIAVDLHQPECVVGVEIGTPVSFVYAERIRGAGGLPVGASGHAALLLSGGIDSPVAGHLAQKRGCSLAPIYFHSPPHTNQRALDKVERLAQRLARSQRTLTLLVVHFSEIQERIRHHAASDLLVVLYRRAMMRIANRLAHAMRCDAIVTGESLGQVASQTIQNIHTIGGVINRPVLRPLIAFDKEETIAIARRIGTYDISIEPHVDCCSLFVPKHPATRVSQKRAAIAEEQLELEPLIAAAADQAVEYPIEPEW